MKYLKIFEKIKPFDEDWEEFYEESKVEYVTAYMDYNHIIIAESFKSGEKKNYIYLNSLDDINIPYNKKYIKSKENIEILPEGIEYIIKVDNRKEILNYKNKIENFINENLNEYFEINNFRFELNDGFYVYPCYISILKKDFNNYINKYFFK